MSVLPAVLAALVSELSTAPALSDVRVFDGPPYEDVSDLTFITVGASLTGATPPVVLAQVPAGLRSTEDAFDITSGLSVFRGDTNITECRSTADQYFEGIRGVVLANPTLGVAGVVSAQLMTAAFTPRWSTQFGCVVDSDLVIRVQAHTIP